MRYSKKTEHIVLGESVSKILKLASRVLKGTYSAHRNTKYIEYPFLTKNDLMGYILKIAKRFWLKGRDLHAC